MCVCVYIYNIYYIYYICVCVAVHLPSPNTDMILLSICWLLMSLDGMIDPLICPHCVYDPDRSLIGVSSWRVDGWDYTIKKVIKKLNTNKQRTGYVFVTIIRFSFSKVSLRMPYYLPIAGFILFPRVLVLCEIQTTLPSIWTWITVSIFYNDKH